jgi:hypothetical protein
MKLHCISELDYKELAFKLSFQNTEFNSSLSLSSTGLPTIGYGFNLQDDRVLTPVLDSLGFDVHGRRLKDDALEAEQYYIGLIRGAFKIVASEEIESLNNVVQSILVARLADKRYLEYHQYKRIARFVYEDKEAVKQCVKEILKNYEKTVDRWLMAFDLRLVNQNPQLFARKSYERLVLLSLAYQGIIGLKPNKAPMFPALGNAFLLDNRPLIWYYIRYYAFSDQEKIPETVMQRYYEGELFGLYDEGVNATNITTAQCKKIYSMYHEYKEYMLDHERQFGESILKANEKFGLTGNKAIKTLEQNFAIAFDHITNTKNVQTLSKQKSSPFSYTASSAPESRIPQSNEDNVIKLNTVILG